MARINMRGRRWSDAVVFKYENENEGSFLENFEAVAQKHEQRRQKIKKDEEIENEKIPPEYRITFGEKPQGITSKEYELLYVETLYTIKYKIGTTIPKHSEGENDLYSYAQEAFGLSMEDHQRLLAKASEEKPPILILNIEIVEAKDLEAKDANGFSDPYCMLGIVPEIRKLVLTQQTSGVGASSDEEGSSDSKLGFMRRLKSFRKSTIRRAQGREKNISSTGSSPQNNCSLRDKLPAKYIQTTDVKKATLNPVWMEKFRFNIESGKTETFHLDIWDHDDEFSVFEAARKLNQVQGFKGLNRYFKQIAQSARTNSNESSNIDDFLGSVNLKISEIPSTGIDRWFSLEGRSENSKVHGQIHIRANLATREDRGISEEDNWTDIKQHVELLQIIIDHELNKFKGETTKWAGELSRDAETILHQHAIQGDITDIQRKMCRWIAYSKKHLERTLTHKLLLTITEQLEQTWQPTSLSRDESDMLREAFTLFINHCFKQLAKLRDLFPAANRIAAERLEQLLTIVAKLHNMEVFRYCCPFQNSLQHELSLILKAGTMEWFDRMVIHITKPRLRSDEEILRNTSELVYVLLADAHSAVKYYNPIFESTVKLAFYHISFKKIDVKLMDIIIKALEEELGEQIYQSPLKLFENTEPDSADIAAFAFSAEQTSLSLFELYLSLNELAKYKIYVNESHRSNLKINQYYLYFGVALKKWLSIARNKLLHRIEYILDKDKSETSLIAPISTTTNNKFTSSSLDISNCFTQMAQFWRRLAWPDIPGSIVYLIKMIEDTTNATRLYAILMEEKLNAKKFYDTNDLTIYIQELSLTVNNIERIRESFKALPIELSYDKLLVAAEKFHPIAGVDEYRKKIETTVAICSQDITDRIYRILSKVITNMEMELKQYLFHIIEAPDASTIQDTIQPLFTFLDNQLVPYTEYLIRLNLTRLLELIWAVLIDQLLCEVEDVTSPKSISSYARLSKALDGLVEYFNNEEHYLPKDILKTDKYKLVKKLLKYQSTDTQSLIKMYYQEKAQEQDRANSSNQIDLGKLYCRAYYHSKEETLYIEIISCKNLRPCDSNGLSDPYVEVQLCPRFLYPHLEKQQTSVIKKTLNPHFNEKFEFRLTEKECNLSGGIVHFIVMDHDLMWSNDFEGEAFLEIWKITGINNDNRAVEELKQIELALTHPKVVRSRIIEILEQRITDKIAVDFVRRRREKENQ
ncbi:unnamed protein product [Rotaria sordida]|uniref:BAI1-associated protein 3 n=1 Tax=Rotaria sordida TaxID=392033 RepID=A0A814AG86_9BILA|nr:unnamed protein product [Rotaria sordida]CAF1344145.1 unnamed protein product [Rotaria sordida]